MRNDASLGCFHRALIWARRPPLPRRSRPGASQSRSWEKRLLTQASLALFTGHVPVSGAVHPAVAAKWMSSPEPASSSVAAKPHLHSTSPAAAEPVTEREVGGKLVALQMATQAARVLIVDDQTLFRSGLAGRLNQERRVHVGGGAADGCDAGQEAEARQAHVVLMDVKMPNPHGVAAAR